MVLWATAGKDSPGIHTWRADHEGMANAPCCHGRAEGSAVTKERLIQSPRGGAVLRQGGAGKIERAGDEDAGWRIEIETGDGVERGHKIARLLGRKPDRACRLCEAGRGGGVLLLRDWDRDDAPREPGEVLQEAHAVLVGEHADDE